MNKKRSPIRPWLIPVFFAIVVAVIGWKVQSVVETTLKQRLSDELNTTLRADIRALELWLTKWEKFTRVIASDSRWLPEILELHALASSDIGTPEALRKSPAQAQLRPHFASLISLLGHQGVKLADLNGRVFASDSDRMIGKTIPVVQGDTAKRVRNGEVVIVQPTRYQAPNESANASDRTAMFTLAPIRNEQGETFAIFSFRISAEVEFAPIFTVARLGDSGETYAFDVNGLMISDSRFNDQLQKIGLLPDETGAAAILNIASRNPGGNLLKGYQPTQPRQAQPLTRMAADAIMGNNGVDVEGYRDYRGVPVVGAWRWLSKHGFGVTTKMDIAEAYQKLYVVRRAFWVLIGILGLTTIGLEIYSVINHRLQRKVQTLGQYTLEGKIGEGGMASVYKARHAMLRRPTAVKLIQPKIGNPNMITQFEREVQLTSQLNHPNTIEIYDYGRTREGVFYYAMEYLDGITLEFLIKVDGPQPENRVIHILRQLCASIAEAHSIGLIHRDIKPANLMLCERGGMYDVVKVLDFGLVKAVQETGDASLTMVGEVRGTPRYMAPEFIVSPEKVDAQSDLYAIGAVAYCLVTGKEVFESATVMGQLSHHLHNKPVPPSKRLGRQIDPKLEELILRCLAKEKEQRPTNALSLLEELNRNFSAAEAERTAEEARLWWEKWTGGKRSPDASTKRLDTMGMSEPTIAVDYSWR